MPSKVKASKEKKPAKAVKTEAKPANTKRKEMDLLRYLKFILVGAQALTSTILIVSLIATNIISGRDIALAIIILGALLAFTSIKLLTPKEPAKSMQIACGVVSGLCIITSVFALRYTDAFNSFLNKITSRSPETVEYSVVVKQDSGIKYTEQLENKSVGYLKTDANAARAEKHFQTVVKANSDFYDDIDTLAGVLENKISSAIVLETARVDMLEEEEAIKDIEIIYTFELELEKSEAVEPTQKEVTTEPFVVYISGSDSRHGIKATARSDVNIVAVVNPNEGKILLVSIPRDTYVQLHGTTGLKDKLTHAGIYGIGMSKATIEDLLGIKIDYTLKVSFDTVVKVVDQLDGIDIESDKEMRLKATGKDKVCEFKVGVQHVDGDCALRFARERKSYTTGDRHRGENQQQVISAIIARLSGSKDYLLKIPAILDIAADSFETSMSRDDITGFVRQQLEKGTKWKTESITVDGSGTYQPTYSMGANRPLYVMITYPASLHDAKIKIADYLGE